MEHTSALRHPRWPRLRLTRCWRFPQVTVSLPMATDTSGSCWRGGAGRGGHAVAVGTGHDAVRDPDHNRTVVSGGRRHASVRNPRVGVVDRMALAHAAVVDLRRVLLTVVTMALGFFVVAKIGALAHAEHASAGAGDVGQLGLRRRPLEELRRLDDHDLRSRARSALLRQRASRRSRSASCALGSRVVSVRS